ncbi:MAG: LamG-like jellyroll fold domain-containing protein, partial [Pirellulales bacterium]
MKVCSIKLLFLSFVWCVIGNVTAQETPQLISHWQLNSQTVQGKKLKAIVGLDGDLTSTPRFVKDSLGQSALFENESDRCVLAADFNDVKTQMPTSAMTVAAWFSVDTRQLWGGIINVLQDNGNYEKGWYLGYGEETFTFGLATTGADDGDGDISYFTAKTNYEVGKLYHVVATFDGKLT